MKEATIRYKNNKTLEALKDLGKLSTFRNCIKFLHAKERKISKRTTPSALPTSGRQSIPDYKIRYEQPFSCDYWYSFRSCA